MWNLASSSSIVSERWDNHCAQLHKRRLRNISSTLDNSAPETTKIRINRGKRAQMKVSESVEGETLGRLASAVGKQETPECLMGTVTGKVQAVSPLCQQCGHRLRLAWLDHV